MLIVFGLSEFGGKYGSICGWMWVLDHDSQFAQCWAEIPLLETVGGCKMEGVKGFDQPFTMKKQNTQLKKKTLRLNP